MGALRRAKDLLGALEHAKQPANGEQDDDVQAEGGEIELGKRQRDDQEEEESDVDKRQKI